MRFTSLISVAAVAALAVAPSTFAHEKVDITDRVDDGLKGIEAGVIGLQQAFLKFTSNGTAAAEAGQMAMEAAAKLGGALNTTTMALHEHHSYIKKCQADETVLVYRHIAGNITIVTEAIRMGKDAIEKVGALQVVHQFLPTFETQLDVLGHALKNKIPHGHGALHAIKKIWQKIDNELELTLKTFGIVDVSCDNNDIARRNWVGGLRRRSNALYVPRA